MSKIIDIEALSKMPITDEFAKILFGENALAIDIEIILQLHDPKLRLLKFRHLNFNDIDLHDDGYVNFTMRGGDIFKIVRYIDNYLNYLGNKFTKNKGLRISEQWVNSGKEIEKKIQNFIGKEVLINYQGYSSFDEPSTFKAKVISISDNINTAIVRRLDIGCELEIFTSNIQGFND